MTALSFGKCLYCDEHCGDTLLVNHPLDANENVCVTHHGIIVLLITPGFLSGAGEAAKATSVVATYDQWWALRRMFDDFGIGPRTEKTEFETNKMAVEAAEYYADLGHRLRAQLPPAPPPPPPKVDPVEAASMARLREILAGFDPHKIKS